MRPVRVRTINAGRDSNKLSGGNVLTQKVSPVIHLMKFRTAPSPVEGRERSSLCLSGQ